MERNQQKGYAQLLLKAKTDKKTMEKLLERMEPLVKAYSRKLFFLNLEDAQQELRIAIIEAVQSIRECNSDGQCLLYIKNAVKYRCIHLCKENMKRVNIIELKETYIENLSDYSDIFEEIEFSYDLSKVVCNMPDKQKRICYFLNRGLTDTEIAEELSVSRQYVNRVKKRIKW